MKCKIICLRSKLLPFILFSVEGELEQEAVQVALEKRGQQWSKRCPLPTARSQLPENHTAAAAAMLVTTGTGSSLPGHLN